MSMSHVFCKLLRPAANPLATRDGLGPNLVPARDQVGLAVAPCRHQVGTKLAPCEVGQ